MFFLASQRSTTSPPLNLSCFFLVEIMLTTIFKVIDAFHGWICFFYQQAFKDLGHFWPPPEILSISRTRAIDRRDCNCCCKKCATATWSWRSQREKKQQFKEFGLPVNYSHKNLSEILFVTAGIWAFLTLIMNLK